MVPDCLMTLYNERNKCNFHGNAHTITYLYVENVQSFTPATVEMLHVTFTARITKKQK